MPRAALLFCLAAALSCACGPEAPVEAASGDEVTLHWTAFVDGKTYDTTEDAGPVTITLGERALPAAVEAAIAGMRAGEEKTISVSGAYGGRDPSTVKSFPAESFAGLGLKPGMKVLGLRDGKPERAAVVKLEGGKVFLDFAHPLADKTVGFRLRLLSIKRR